MIQFEVEGIAVMPAHFVIGVEGFLVVWGVCFLLKFGNSGSQICFDFVKRRTLAALLGIVVY